MDSETYPERPTHRESWWKATLLMAIILLALALGWSLISVIGIRAQPYKRAEKVEATSNARQIGLALFEFETDYGAYPNTTTIALVEKENGTAINLTGTSSNTLFRQLFAAQMTQSELMFHAAIKGFKWPDNDATSGHLLEPGECGFSYISGLSSKDNPLTPIVLTPLIPGTTMFDPKPFDGKAVVLHIDNSVRIYDIHKDGHIYDKGIALLSPANPIWNGKTPDIRYPE